MKNTQWLRDETDETRRRIDRDRHTETLWFRRTDRGTGSREQSANQIKINILDLVFWTVSKASAEMNVLNFVLTGLLCERGFGFRDNVTWLKRFVVVVVVVVFAV